MKATRGIQRAAHKGIFLTQTDDVKWLTIRLRWTNPTNRDPGGPVPVHVYFGIVTYAAILTKSLDLTRLDVIILTSAEIERDIEIFKISNSFGLDGLHLKIIRELP